MESTANTKQEEMKGDAPIEEAPIEEDEPFSFEI